MNDSVNEDENIEAIEHDHSDQHPATPSESPHRPRIVDGRNAHLLLTFQYRSPTQMHSSIVLILYGQQANDKHKS